MKTKLSGCFFLGLLGDEFPGMPNHFASKFAAKKGMEKAIAITFVLINRTPIMQEDAIFRERGNG